MSVSAVTAPDSAPDDPIPDLPESSVSPGKREGNKTLRLFNVAIGGMKQAECPGAELTPDFGHI